VGLIQMTQNRIQ